MSIKKVTLKNGDTKWEVRLHESGRGSKRVTRRFDRKVDADCFIADLQKKIMDHKRSPFQIPTFDGKTLNEEAQKWLESIRLIGSPGHILATESYLAPMLKKYGSILIERMTFELVEKIQAEGKKEGLENSTVNKKVQILQSILNYSVSMRRIPMNPLKGARKLPEAEKEMLFWSKEEAMSFLKCTSKKYPKGTLERWKYVVYLLCLNTGLRAGEVWGLKPSDITSDGLRLHILRQYNSSSHTFTATKGKNTRYVPCNQEVLGEVRDLIRIRDIGMDETIFMSEVRTPIVHRNFVGRWFEKDVKFWAKYFEGKVIRFHDLRHTATTHMVAEGINLITVQEICGHEDLETTRRYAHVLGDAINKVAKNYSLSVKDGKENSTDLI